MEDSTVSVIIPALNEERYLPKLLESLRGGTIPIDIIVVDGSSEDGTVRAVKAFEPYFGPPSSLTVLQNAKRNISHQRNLGAANARGDILIFCDADLVFPPGAFEKLVSVFRKKRYVAAAPQLGPIEKRLDFRLLYVMLRLAQRMLHAIGRAYFPGACVVTRKDIFRRTEGFDELVPLGEDIDYSLRASKLGRTGIIRVKVLTSMRRYIKYGYSWILSEIPNIVRLVFTGRIKHETIFYPFGGYHGHAEHHANR